MNFLIKIVCVSPAEDLATGEAMSSRNFNILCLSISLKFYFRWLVAWQMQEVLENQHSKPTRWSVLKHYF